MVIRVGTSGALQASTKLGTPIITTYAVGLDNTGLYYEAPFPDENCQRLEAELSATVKNFLDKKSRFYGKIHPYVTRAHQNLVIALSEAAEKLGIPAKTGLTASAPGFSAPQGRDTARVKPSILEMDKILSEFDPRIDNQRFENMEMEASFLIHLLGGSGYWAGAICPTIANRRQDTFDVHYHESVKNTINVALLALATIRNRYPDVRVS